MNTPIFFSFKTPFGDETLQRTGRAVFRNSLWMYGVNPGMICGEGPSIDAAYASFKVNLLALAIDVLKDNPVIPDFLMRFNEFFDSTNAANLKEWEAARERVRREGPRTLATSHSVVSLETVLSGRGSIRQQRRRSSSTPAQKRTWTSWSRTPS